MADTLVGDAVAYPQDEGLSGIADDNESWASAGYMAGLSRFVGSSGFVQSGLTFSGHDATNDQVDVDAGRCFIVASTATMSVDVQSTVGGTAAPSYDTTLQGQIPILVELPTKVTNLAAQDSTLSAIWVAYDNDGTGPGSAGSVYIRTDDTGSVSAPSHPSVKLGEANPDDSTADTRANDNPTETFESLTTDEVNVIKHPDDLAEMQTMIDEFTEDAGRSSQDGVKFVLPNGTLTPSSSDLPINLNITGVIIEGHGDKPTEIDISGIGKPLFKRTTPGDAYAFRNLLINGDTTSGSKFVKLTSCNDLEFSKLFINKLDTACDMADCTTVSWDVVTISDGSGAAVKVRPSSGNGNQRWSFRAVEFNSNQHGLDAEQGAVWEFHGSISHNTDHGMILNDINNIEIHGWFEGNGTNATNPAELVLKGNAESVTVSESIMDPYTNGGAIRFSDTTSATVRGTTFTGDSDGEAAFQVNDAGNGITIDKSNHYDTANLPTVIERDPTETSRDYKLTNINNGAWRTDEFGAYGEISSFTSTLKSNNNLPIVSFELVITHNISTSGVALHGNDFPPDTTFKGISKQILIESTSTGDHAVRLAQDGQVLENCTVKDTQNWICAEAESVEAGFRDVIVAGAGDDGMRLASDRTFAHNCIFKSGSIGSEDINIQNAAVVTGCDYDTLSVSESGELIDGTCIDSHNLGGSDGSASVKDRGPTRYRVQVDAGGSNTNLQGIDGPTHDGAEVAIIHTGGESVILEDDAAVTNPLKNQSNANDTLDANGEMAVYIYDAQSSAWRQTALNQQA